VDPGRACRSGGPAEARSIQTSPSARFHSKNPRESAIKQMGRNPAHTQKYRRALRLDVIGFAWDSFYAAWEARFLAIDQTQCIRPIECPRLF